MTDDGKMETMDQAAVAPRRSYLWAVPGKPVSVQLEIDLVDRLLQEIMRGFGVVPRRGVEMGGILWGSVQVSAEGYRVVVEDFEPVPCQHSKGPAWLLCDEEQVLFEDTLARWAHAEGKRTFAVGFYRSHTREGLGMTEEDQAIYGQYFRDPAAIALLVKPFATRTATGALFFREAGGFKSDATYLEFPFHPGQLSGDEGYGGGIAAGGTPEGKHRERAERRGLTELNLGAPPKPSPAIKHLRSGPPALSFAEQGGLPMASASNTLTQDSMTPDQLRFGIPTATRDAASGRRQKTGWVWIPLSFVFVLVGLVLGMLVTASVGLRLPGPAPETPYTLGVSIAPSGEGLLLRWDRSSAAIENATSGQLTIQDGGASKTVPLDAVQLRNGSVIYRNASPNVTFRLEVNTSERVSLSETAQYQK
ncbi:MAG: hypothetical protein R2762_03755 [Bryobacteraceae bacterium]